MYEKAENKVRKTANQIVDNLNDIAKPKRKMGTTYLEGGKGIVDVDLKGGESDVGKKLGNYMEKTVDNVKKASKKVKVNIEN